MAADSGGSRPGYREPGAMQIAPGSLLVPRKRSLKLTTPRADAQAPPRRSRAAPSILLAESMSGWRWRPIVAQQRLTSLGLLWLGSSNSMVR